MNISKVREILSALSIKPSKKRGQNFLFDNNTINKIIDFADLDYNLPVIEIGPGLGALTEVLSDKSKLFSVIELEEQFAKRISVEFPKIKVFNQDILNFSLESLIEGNETGNIQIISNLPYSISSPVIFWLIDNSTHIKEATLLLQREFAERIATQPGNRNTGIPSVILSLIADVSLGPIVGKKVFFPEPDVESRLLKIKFTKNIPEVDLGVFKKVVRSAFSMRRKTLLNCLIELNQHDSENSFSSITKDRIVTILLDLDLKENVRAEELSLRNFIDITKKLIK